MCKKQSLFIFSIFFSAVTYLVSLQLGARLRVGQSNILQLKKNFFFETQLLLHKMENVIKRNLPTVNKGIHIFLELKVTTTTKQ